LGSVESTPQEPGFHLEPWIQGTVCSGALASQSGDALLLKLSYTGSQSFTVIDTSMTIP
jgi:hypothetical protein